MGLFSRWFGNDDEPEVLDEDEFLEQLSDDELYVDDVPLESTVISVRLRSLEGFGTDAFLEGLEQLPYEFRMYFDTRRAFSRAYSSMKEEIAYFESYEGGRSVEYDEYFEYDDHTVTINFTLSRDGDSEPFVFSADIKIDNT